MRSISLDSLVVCNFTNTNAAFIDIWRFPSLASFKLNLANSLLGNLGQTGIGHMFKNHFK